MSNRVKFTREYGMHCSPEFLNNYISTPAGLAEWFADDVLYNGHLYTFVWEGSEAHATMGTHRKNFYKFNWTDRPGEYVSFEISVDEMTGDVALIITDFENENELEEAHMMYDVSINRLHQTIG